MSTCRDAFFRILSVAIITVSCGLSPAFAQFNISGACCQPDGSCTVISAFSCLGQGQTFLGGNTTCVPGACFGACCQPDGICTEGDLPFCAAFRGEFIGVGTTCATATCRDTSFIYQGRLEDAGAPADGVYDLRFRLFSDAIAGDQAGPTLCIDNQGIVKGFFTQRLDFGHQFATSEERHLEIEVRQDTGTDCSNPGGFVVLAPRQPITNTPRALHAESAFALDGVGGGPLNAVYVDNIGNVGIGTTIPTAKLEVDGTVVITRTGDQAEALWLGIERSWVFKQQGTGAGTALKLQSIGGGGNKHFLIQTDGLVGIGTIAPTAKLDVRGDVKMGSNGQFFAAAGEENLRIVRGTIVHNGPDPTPIGFSVNRVGAGDYSITFNPPFAAKPAITASADGGGNVKLIALPEVHSASSATVYIYGNTMNTLFDATFHFIAVGPR